MNSFLDELTVTPLPDAINWRLDNIFRCQDDELGLITAPKGLVTDFTSIPEILHPIVGDPWGWYGWGAVIHDLNYRVQKFTRIQSDDCLHRCMETLSLVNLPSNSFLRFLVLTKRQIQMDEIYYGVRIGGWSAWNKYAKTPYVPPNP